MTGNEAYEILKKKYDFLLIKTCYEYPDRFVFETTPKNMKIPPGEIQMGGLIAVLKNTGRVRSFTPLDISIEDYHEGRKVAISK